MANPANSLLASRRLAWVIGFFVILPSVCPGALTWDIRKAELTVKPGAHEIVQTFGFRNSGTVAVTILEVHASCGCTTVHLSKKTLAPQESGEIKASVALSGMVGRQEKSIMVTTDDAPDKPVQLDLVITVPELFTCSERVLLWRIGDALADKVVTIAPIASEAFSKLELKGIVPDDAVVRLKAIPNEKGYRLYVHPRSSAKIGQTAIAGIATFADGATQPFSVFALIR